MSGAGDVDDPRCFGSLQFVQEKVSEEEVAEVVHLEHRLLPVLSQSSPRGEHAGVVDEDVHLLLFPSNLPAELPDTGKGGQVTLLHPDIWQTNISSRSLRSLQVPSMSGRMNNFPLGFCPVTCRP